VTIKVLIVDDSALMRRLLTEIIDGTPDLEVVGATPDPTSALEMIKAMNPDVLTLDVEIPKMDGLAFLEWIMRFRPMPVVMISSLTERGSEVTLRALELGAVDFVSKPRVENISVMQNYAEDIRDKIRAARAARLGGRVASTTVAGSVRRPVTSSLAEFPDGKTALSPHVLNQKLIAIGASTGGTEAIKAVLAALPAEVPGIVMVQHMPESFTPSFAKRLDMLSKIRVVEAQGGERIQPGHAYLAPGHSHLLVRKNGTNFVTELVKSETVNRHRPSVDVLFRSLVTAGLRQNVIGVILTGMGKDGAQGLLEMRQTGAWTIGQDQESCVVYGMPREAAQVGALGEVAPLSEVAGCIMARLHSM